MECSPGFATFLDLCPYRAGRLFEGVNQTRYRYIKKDLSPSDEGNETVNKENRFVLDPPAAMGVKTDLNVKDVVAENVKGSGAEINSAGKKECVRKVANGHGLCMHCVRTSVSKAAGGCGEV